MTVLAEECSGFFAGKADLGLQRRGEGIVVCAGHLPGGIGGGDGERLGEEAAHDDTVFIAPTRVILPGGRVRYPLCGNSGYALGHRQPVGALDGEVQDGICLGRGQNGQIILLG